MNFQLHDASRQAFKPLIVLYSESGCGKTFSALLLARGMAGPDGKIVMGDSESGRGRIYADIIDGGYKTFDIKPPFAPANYVAALNFIEQSGAAVGILDSGSHEWEGIGGVLDMAAKAEEKSGRPGLHNWREPKFEHGKFVQRLLAFPIPLIVCLRAKYKTRQTKDDKGKTQIIKDDYTSPIQAEDFIFEATCHIEILPKHNISVTKGGHPLLEKCFPKPEEGPLTMEHGRKIAAWCAAAGSPAKPPSTPPLKATSLAAQKDLKMLKKELWELTERVHHGEARLLYQWLIDEALIDQDMNLETLTEKQLAGVISKVKLKL